MSDMYYHSIAKLLSSKFSYNESYLGWIHTIMSIQVGYIWLIINNKINIFRNCNKILL